MGELLSWKFSVLTGWSLLSSSSLDCQLSLHNIDLSRKSLVQLVKQSCWSHYLPLQSSKTYVLHIKKVELNPTSLCLMSCIFCSIRSRECKVFRHLNHTFVMKRKKKTFWIHFFLFMLIMSGTSFRISRSNLLQWFQFALSELACR